MKKTFIFLTMIFAMLLNLTFVYADGTTPIKKNATVVEVSDKTIEVNTDDGQNRYVLNVSDDTFIMDSTNGNKLSINDIKKDSEIIAYFGPATTRSLPPQSNAVAIVSNLPKDVVAPSYASVEDIENLGGSINAKMENGSVIAKISYDSDIVFFGTNQKATLEDIKVGTRIAYFSKITALSFPAKVEPSKVVILVATKTEPTKEESKDLTISDKKLPTDNKIVKGTLPEFKGGKDLTFPDKLNAKVDKIYKDAYEKAVKDKSVELDFSYKTVKSDKYTSIIISTYASAGNTGSDEVNTFVFENSSSKIVTLTDFLGKDAYLTAERAVKEAIAKSPDKYYSGENAFSTIKTEPSFYVDEKNNVVILFNKYSIAPGSTGVPSFVIETAQTVKDNKSYTILASDMFVKDSVKMVPLRKVANGLGYSLTWMFSTNTITLTNKVDTYNVVIGKAVYGQKTLEVAPMFKDGVAYVPVSYFEKVMNLSTFIEKDGSIILKKDK